jgi:hypothetical protein
MGRRQPRGMLRLVIIERDAEGRLARTGRPSLRNGSSVSDRFTALQRVIAPALRSISSLDVRPKFATRCRRARRKYERIQIR